MRPIDADALERRVYTGWLNGELSNSEWIDFREWLKDEPTVEPASPWHKCEDELPPSNENLLCCGSRGGMFVGWVLGSAVCICGSCTGFVHGGKGRQFTHWMPLP